MSEKAKRQASIETLDTGLGARDRGKVAEALVPVLADSYILLIKTHVYHWNVVGEHFLPLHELTEAHYTNLFAAVDEIAERIRSLGKRAPLSLSALRDKASVEEETVNRTAEEMVAHLVDDHEQLTKRLREAALLADESDDLVTADLLTQRLAFHEKAIWMLRAILGKA